MATNKKKSNLAVSISADTEKNSGNKKKTQIKADSGKKSRTKTAKRKKRGYIEYDKEILLDLIKEKIETGELKYISKIGTLKGMPSYRYIKKLWTIEELNDIFGIKLKVYSYTNGKIIKEYYRIKEKYDVITSDIMKKETVRQGFK